MQGQDTSGHTAYPKAPGRKDRAHGKTAKHRRRRPSFKRQHQGKRSRHRVLHKREECPRHRRRRLHRLRNLQAGGQFWCKEARDS